MRFSKVIRIASWVVLCGAGTYLTAQQVSPHLYNELRWRMIGPFRGGRTVAATGIPSQQNVFYVAANNGGVWKSSDFGLVWKPLFDDQPTGSIGALAVAPSNPQVIYVGSGEGLQRPDLSTGDGIYKSIDGGKSWKHLGLRDGQQISAILVHPRDPNRVYVAVLGHPYGPNEERGVFRSTDGGENWQKILYKDENTGAIDLAFSPTDPQRIYAALWAGRQAPWEVGGSFNGPGSGLFQSNDGGDSWAPLTEGLPTIADGLGRIGLGVSPNDANRLYALVDATRGGGLYRSDDAGKSWRLINTEARLWGRGSDFACVRVDPTDKDVLYIANTSTYRSSDAGKSWTAIKGAPGGDDYHTIWINPENPKIILLAADQGATISVNGGETWSSWYNQPTAQFYHVSTDNRFPYWVYGGQQESGSAGVASRSDYGEISFRDWHPVGVEEYGYVAPDPLNPNLVYGGKVTRFNHVTGEVQNVGPSVLRSGKYRFLRTAPLLFSQADPHVLLLGSQVLFKTVNGGQSWDVISPDLTRGSYDVPPSLGIFTSLDPEKGKHRGVIYTIAPSPKDVKLIWIGTDDGLIQVTRDGGKSWKDVTPGGLTPWSKVSIMDGSHFDSQSVYAAVNRIRLDDLRPHIYRTHDGGKTWSEIVRGIPADEVINAVREDPIQKGLLFAGSERAVYFSTNDGDDWSPLRLNMPATSIRDLVVHGDDLVVGTHGRSFWILDDITPLRQLGPAIANERAVLFRPAVTYRVRRNQNTDTPLPPEEPAGQNPPDGAILNYFLGAESSGPVTLDILDHAGKLVRRYSSEDKPEVPEDKLTVPTYWIKPSQVLAASPGMHRFVWDLHYPPPDSLGHQYPISAIYRDTPRYPLGPVALPGAYTARLIANGKTLTQPLTVRMDPRVKTPLAALVGQFTVSSTIVANLHQDFMAISEVRALQKQLASLPASGKDLTGALEKKLTDLLGSGGGRRGGGDTLTGLNNELTALLEILQGPDSAPTSQALAAAADRDKALKSAVARWSDIKSVDLPALNNRLKQSNLSPIVMPGIQQN